MSDWKNVQYKDGKYRTGEGGGGGGSSTLAGLDDVDLNNLQDGQIIKWDATNDKFVNANESGGGSSGHSYSTSEQKTNDVWIDGKPIYEKTFNIQSPTTGNTWSSVPHGISNIETVVNISGIALWVLNSGNTISHLPLTFRNEDNTSYNIGIRTVNSDIQYIVSNNYGSGITNIWVTLRYTKTTD